MTRLSVFLLAPLLALAAPGCSSAAFTVAPSSDGRGDDASLGDATSDTSRPDDGVDSGAARADASPTDGLVPDGIIGDGAVSDAIGADAVATDVTSEVAPDGAPVCPSPPSDATFDATLLDCDVLIDEYVKAFTGATTCGCNEDCSQLACVDLCCVCYGWVSPADPAYPKLNAIKTEFEARVAAGKCSRPTTCASCAIAKPTSAGCHGSGPGTPRTCR